MEAKNQQELQKLEEEEYLRRKKELLGISAVEKPKQNNQTERESNNFYVKDQDDSSTFSVKHEEKEEDSYSNSNPIELYDKYDYEEEYDASDAPIEEIKTLSFTSTSNAVGYNPSSMNFKEAMNFPEKSPKINEKKEKNPPPSQNWGGFKTAMTGAISSPPLQNVEEFNGKMVFSSSLVVMPSSELWKPIVDIKKNHMNPRIKRPPYPHITLLQPFCDRSKFTIATRLLRKVTENIEPFQIKFEKFEIFKNGTSFTLFLNPIITVSSLVSLIIKPPNALQILYESVAKVFPQSVNFVNDKTGRKPQFEPHIGVGYFRTEKEAVDLQKKYQSGWKPIQFEVKEIYLMYRDGQETPFEVRGIVPLGKKPSQPNFQIVP